MRNAVLLGLSCLVIACGGARTSELGPEGGTHLASLGSSAATSTPLEPTSLPTANDGAAPASYVVPKMPDPSPPPAPLAVSVRDPKIVAMAKAAALCKLEQGVIEYQCKAYQRWLDEQDLFADGKGNATLLSLLEDTDPKLRQVAAGRGFHKAAAFFVDKENARHLIATAVKETDAPTAKALGARVAAIHADKVGLEGELFQLTKSPHTGLRSELAWNLDLGRPPSPFELVMAEQLANDADEHVRINMLRRLNRPDAAAAACTLLARALRREDASGAEALETLAQSKCLNVHATMLETLEKRVRAMDPKSAIVGYGTAAAKICDPDAPFDAAARKRAFAVGQALLAKEDCWVKVRAVAAVVACDRAAARPLIEPLANAQCMDLKAAANAALKAP